MNVDKTKGMQLLFGKKNSISKVDLGVYGCNSFQCTKCQRRVHRRCSDVPRQVILLSYCHVFVCRTCLGHNCSVEEKLEFKRGEDVLEEVEKFCYMGDMISCYGRASEAVTARIGCAWKKFRELSGGSREAGFIIEIAGRFISVVLLFFKHCHELFIKIVNWVGDFK